MNQRRSYGNYLYTFSRSIKPPLAKVRFFLKKGGLLTLFFEFFFGSDLVYIFWLKIIENAPKIANFFVGAEGGDFDSISDKISLKKEGIKTEVFIE